VIWYSFTKSGLAVLRHHITSHHITSHHITSHHITSHHLNSSQQHAALIHSFGEFVPLATARRSAVRNQYDHETGLP
jgi:hypothetical protein